MSNVIHTDHHKTEPIIMRVDRSKHQSRRCVRRPAGVWTAHSVTPNISLIRRYWFCSAVTSTSGFSSFFFFSISGLNTSGASLSFSGVSNRTLGGGFFFSGIARASGARNSSSYERASMLSSNGAQEMTAEQYRWQKQEASIV